jgi:hypothetical protein
MAAALRTTLCFTALLKEGCYTFPGLDTLRLARSLPLVLGLQFLKSGPAALSQKSFARLWPCQASRLRRDGHCCFHLIPFAVTIPPEERDADLAEKLKDE